MQLQQCFALLDHSVESQFPYISLFVPCLFKEKRGDIVFGFPWFCPPSNSRYIVCTTPPTVLCWSFWNFTDVFVMVWKCACGLDILEFIFHFFRILNLVTFKAWILSKDIDSGYLVCTTPSAVLCWSFWNFTGVFVMVWRCACGLDIILRLIFVTFSAFWT